MSTYGDYEWEVGYINSNGEFVSAFKSESDAPCFLRHVRHGYFIPACMVWDTYT